MFIQMEENNVGGVFAYVKDSHLQPMKNSLAVMWPYFTVVAILVWGKSVQFLVKYIENRWVCRLSETSTFMYLRGKLWGSLTTTL